MHITTESSIESHNMFLAVITFFFSVTQGCNPKESHAHYLLTFVIEDVSVCISLGKKK